MNDDTNIEPPPANPRRKGYYQGLLRWRVKRPLVLLLLFLWSFGIFQGYRYEPEEHWDGSSVDLALHYLDRELRLAEALEDKPAVLRWFLWEEPREETLGVSLASLQALERATALGGGGDLAKEVLLRELGKAPNANEPLIQSLDESQSAEFEAQLDDGTASWWVHEAIEQSAAGFSPGLAVLGQRQDREMNQALLSRAIVANGLSWAVFIVGLFCIPAAWKTIRTGFRQPLPIKRRYGWSWPATLILALFVITDWIGGWFYDLAYQFAPASWMSFGFDVAVDFIWRFIPILLLLFILFRRPSHAMRSMGLKGKPDWKLILGVFSILGIIDLGLYPLMEPLVEIDPTGGLHPLEFGWPGLFYGLLSACIAAPLAEELLYRGTLLRGLATRRGFWFAAIVSTVAFIVCHYYDAYGSISVGIFGLSAAIVYRATGSLTHSIALHALYNLTITTSSWLIYQSPL